MSLKTLRTRMNFTQKQLAEKMDTTQQTMARWETGKTQLNADQIKQLCGILQCTAQELLGWKAEWGEEVAFDESSLFEFGFPFGTLKLGMACGTREFPIGDVAKGDVEAFLDRHSVLHHNKGGKEWIVVTTLSKRLMLVNFAAVRTVGLVSDEIEAMPAYHDAAAPVDDAGPQADGNVVALHDELRVTFIDGAEGTYRLTESVAQEVYGLLLASEAPRGSVMMIESEEGGQQRTYVQLGEVAMINLPAGLFAELTGDDHDAKE
jgi:transcriptional regulator with XRE-family HTH domain